MIGALNVSGGQVAKPLPRLEPQVPFGPGIPLQIGTIDPLREDTGRPEPRIYEYPVTINLPGMTDRLVPWKVLRDASEIPVVRDCIRIRKNEITSLEWDITIAKRALQQYRKDDPDTSSVEIKRKLRAKLDPDVGRLVEFWQMPDWQQGESFTDWATKGLEEHLVLDALAAYPYKDRAGKRIGLRLLDGSTVKPLLDHLGGRPMPPNPAYQQILWGFPRGEFVADVDDDGNVLNGYESDRLIYKRREVRTITPYGFSAVEQSLQDVDLYLRRMEWDRAAYTEGTQPAGWFKNTGMESWTPQQIIDYNRAFNDLFAGQTLNRMRYHLLPPGIEPMESADVSEKYKPDYHLHLIKLVAMHFDVTLAELGFTESKGLGSSGYHEGQENVQQRKATNPTLKWLQTVITEISRTHLGMPWELEFRFLGLDAEEENAADEVIDRQLKSARITLNEAREELGRAPYNFREADMPIVETARGIVFLEDASTTTAPGAEINPLQAPPPKAPPTTAIADANGADQQDGDQQDVSKAAQPTTSDRVYTQLLEDYPPNALQWVKTTRWTGPEPIALSKVDFSHADTWTASREPDKVARFAKLIDKGKLDKPVILVQTPTNKKLIVIDGHHRSLAYRSLGKPILAWVAHVKAKTGPWDEMHDSQYTGHGDTQTAPKTAKPDPVKAELAAYWKWLRNGHTTTRRPFEFSHVTKTVAMLNEIALDTVSFKAGDAPDPKGQRRHWPAWERDLEVAEYWSKQLRAALTGAPTRQIADRWLAARKAVDSDQRRDAEQWLVGLGVSFTPSIRRTLLGLWVDGYVLGDKAAQALLSDVEHVTWGDWQPGDTAAARLIVGADGADLGLQRLLADADRIASGINSTRIRDVASALVKGLDDGLDIDSLDAELAGLLDDEAAAMRVTVTETARAINSAALARYDLARLDGVTGVSWVAGANSCDRCKENAATGPIPIGQSFPNGQAPPAHPHCGCYLEPQYGGNDFQLH